MRLIDFEPISRIPHTPSSRIISEIEQKRALCSAYFRSNKPIEAYEISRKTLSPAIRLHLSGAVIDFAKYCRHYFSTVKFNRERIKSYNQIIESHRRIRDNEDEMDRKYIDYILIIKRKKEVVLEESFINEIKRILNGSKNFYTAFRGYIILTSYAISKKKDKEAIQYCSTALKYFNSLQFKTYNANESFALLETSCLINLEEFDKASSIILQYKPTTKTRNYFRFLQLEVINMIRAGNYQSGFDFVENTSINRCTPIFREEWKIITAYLHAFAQLHIIERDSKFKIGKFLNEIEVYSTDVKGNNVNLIILEILFRYAQNQIEIHDRTAAYRVYIAKHLKKKSRSYILLSGLIKWINSNFSYQFEKELPKLNETPPNSVDLEIIKYQDLIGLLLETS